MYSQQHQQAVGRKLLCGKAQFSIRELASSPRLIYGRP